MKLEDIYKGAEKPEVVEMKKKVHSHLSKIRYELLLSRPFIGSIGMKLDLIPVRDVRVRTACTDGQYIYFIIDFYKKLDDDDHRQFVLAHEIWHVVYMHMLRVQNRDMNFWNIATDCEINYMLKHDGFKLLKDVCMAPSEVEGKNAEIIYDFIVKKYKQLQVGNKGKTIKKNGGSKKNNSSKNSSSKSEFENSEEIEKKLGKNFDKHVYEKNNGEGNSQPKDENGNIDFGVSDEYGEVGFDRDYNPCVKSESADKIREMIVSAVQHCERTQGKVPAGIEKYIKDIMKPEISWKEVLAQFVTRNIKSDRHWGPFNRRYLYKKMYLPGKSGEFIKLAVIVDTSGSCTEDIPKFLSELFGITSQWEHSSVTLIQCDADVQSVDVYDEDNPFTNEIKNLKVKGFGGSDFRPAFKYIANSDEDYDCIVAFTDGFIDFPKERAKVPTLVVLTGDGAEECCDWAQILKFKE